MGSFLHFYLIPVCRQLKIQDARPLWMDWAQFTLADCRAQGGRCWCDFELSKDGVEHGQWRNQGSLSKRGTLFGSFSLSRLYLYHCSIFPTPDFCFLFFLCPPFLRQGLIQTGPEFTVEPGYSDWPWVHCMTKLTLSCDHPPTSASWHWNCICNTPCSAQTCPNKKNTSGIKNFNLLVHMCTCMTEAQWSTKWSKFSLFIFAWALGWNSGC